MIGNKFVVIALMMVGMVGIIGFVGGGTVWSHPGHAGSYSLHSGNHEFIHLTEGEGLHDELSNSVLVAEATGDSTTMDSDLDIPAHKTAHEVHSAETHAQGPQLVIAKELEEVGIEEHVGDSLTGNMIFTNRLGQAVPISNLLMEQKPILLSFFYATCPSLCQYVLNAKAETLSKLGLDLGNDYLAVSVSFDERDTPELMEASYQKYMSLYKAGSDQGHQQHKKSSTELPVKENATKVSESLANDGWTFLSGDKTAIMRLTTQLGFLFKRLDDDPTTEEFAHTAAMYVITPNGKISRYFYGLLYPPFDVKMALVEAKKEQERSTLDRILLYCYRYDHEAKGYVLFAQNVMKAGGVAIVLFLGIFISMMWRFEKKRGDKEIAEAASHHLS